MYIADSKHATEADALAVESMLFKHFRQVDPGRCDNEETRSDWARGTAGPWSVYLAWG